MTKFGQRLHSISEELSKFSVLHQADFLDYEKLKLMLKQEVPADTSEASAPIGKWIVYFVVTYISIIFYRFEAEMKKVFQKAFELEQSSKLYEWFIGNEMKNYSKCVDLRGKFGCNAKNFKKDEEKSEV